MPASNARRTKSGSAERGEQRLVETGGPGEQPDEHSVGGVELLQGGRAGAARDVGHDRHGVLAGLAPPLVEGRGDELDAAVGGLHDLVGDQPGQFWQHIDDLFGADRQCRRVEDLPIEQVGDLVELLRQEPPSQRDSGVARRVLESFDECPHGFVIELLNVVDDECLVSERFVTERADLAP